MRRYSRQLQQEDQSLGDLKSRLADYGWPSNRMERDLGEDMLVQIYDSGVSSGLDFYVQVKSTKDPDVIGCEHPEACVTYPIEVVHLLHWRDFQKTIVLVVWDVVAKVGYWVRIDDALKDLKDRNPAWESNEKVNVHIPLAQQTHDAGLASLRRSLALDAFERLSRGRIINIKARFLFPNTEDGQNAHNDLMLTLGTGSPSEIDGRFIKKWDEPEWMQRILGERTLKKVSLASNPSDIVHMVRLEMSALAGTHLAAFGTGLRVVQAGEDEITFSNRDSTPLLEITLVFNRKEHRISWHHEIHPRSASALQVIEVIDFINAVLKGGTLRLIFEHPTSVHVLSIHPRQAEDQLSGSVIKIRSQLEIVQKAVANIGTLVLPCGIFLTENEERALEVMHLICTTGRLEHVVTMSFSADGPTLEALMAMAGSAIDEDAVVHITHQHPPHQLFNLEIPLGAGETQVALTPEFLAALSKTQNTPGCERVELSDARVIDTFPDWWPSQLTAASQ